MAEIDPTITRNTRLLRRQRDSRSHSLEQFEGEGAPRQVVIGAEGVVIGRAADTTVRLTTKSASRQHALITMRGTECVVTDNDSHNGIFLNGVKIHSAVLRDGDVLQVADAAFIYRED